MEMKNQTVKNMTTFLDNLPSILNAAHKNGDPLAEMTRRTSGLSLVDVHQFSDAQIINAAFGAGVANAILRPDGTVRGDRVTAELFVLYAKLFLKKRLKPGASSIVGLPVASHMKVAAPSMGCLVSTNPRQDVMSADIAALDWIGAIGTPASIPTAVKEQVIEDLRQVVRLAEGQNLTDWIKESAKSGTHNGLLHLFLARRMPEVTFFGNTLIPEDLPNYIFVDGKNFWAFDFHATAADVAYVGAEIARISTLTGAEAQIKLAPGKHNGVDVMFLDFEAGKDSGYRRVMIHPTDGVYEMARMRRFGQTLVTGHCLASTGSEMSLLSSYQTFLTWLFRFLPAFMGTSQSVKEIGLMYDKYIKNDDRTGVPITAVEDLGAVDGDRQHLDFRSAKVRSYGEKFQDGQCIYSWNPFGLQYVEDGQAKVVARPLAVMELAVKRAPKAAHGQIEAAAFETFNLVRQISSNGALLDGRRACIRVCHIPDQYKQEFVSAIEERYLNGKSWASHAGSRHEDGAIDKLVLCLSSKVAKLIKRTAMDAAVVAQMKGGKQRHSRIWGQKHKSENNVMIPALISQHLLGAAGNGYLWDREIIQLENPKCQSWSPDINCKIDQSGLPVIQLVKEGKTELTQSSEGWITITWLETPRINLNEEIAFFVYTIEGKDYEFPIVNKLDGMVLEQLHYRLANSVGRKKSLEVKLSTRSFEFDVKARNHIKAVMAPCSETVFNNGLNGDAFAKALFPADTNKWGDLVKSKFDVAAATFTENREHPKCHKGYARLRMANQIIGCGSHDDAIWAPIAAALGAYDEVLAEFDRVFGRAVWVMWNDGLVGDWSTGLKLLYTFEGRPVKGWKDVDPSELPFGSDLTDIKAIADGDLADPSSNVLVFAKNASGESIIFQRGWSYVGTEDCPVYQPLKGELSSIADNVGFSDTMGGVLRMISTKDRETAISLMRGNAKRVARSAGLFVMARGRNAGTAVPCVTPTGIHPDVVSVIRTDELREIVSGPAHKGHVLSELARTFGDTFFLLENGTHKFSINFSVLCSQDANHDFASDESLSAVVEYLFRELILGDKLELTPSLNNLMARVASKLNSLVESDGLNKSCSVGAPVLGARSAGIPGIPTSEVWVAESTDSRSVYQKFVKGYKNILVDLGKFTGVKLYGYRAPMTNPMIVKLVVIGQDDYRHKLISPMMWNVNCLINNIHGGDNDGDTNYFGPLVKKIGGTYFESSLPFTTLEDVFDSVRMRTGSDQLATLDEYGVDVIQGGDRYYADHNSIKSKAAIDKKNGVSAKNLILSDNPISDDGSVDKATMTSMLTRSTEMIKIAVGQTHTFVLQADIFACLMNDLIKFGYIDADKSGPFFVYEGIIAALYEIYEVPLGGLDDAAYDILFDLLIPLSKKPDAAIDPLPHENHLVDGSMTGRQYWVDKFDEAGMCSQLFDQVLEAAHTIGSVTESVRETYKLKWYNADAQNLIADSQFGFVSAVTYLTLLLSKGRVRASYNAAGQLNKVGKILLDVVNTIKGNEYLSKLASQDLTLQSLMIHNDLMISAMTGQDIELDFGLFIEQSNDTENEDEDEGDGGSTVDTEPKDPTPTPPSGSQDAEETMGKNFDNFKGWYGALPQKVQDLPEWATMSDDQLMAVYVICNGIYDCVTLTGRAGSGKSFTTQFAAKVLRMCGKEVHVTGTTGVATINAGGDFTINSLAKIGTGSDQCLPLGHSDHSASSRRTSIGRQASVNFKKYGPEIIIFIDEVSMASPENLALAYQSIYTAVGNSRPFRFVLVGDFRQLAPVKSSRFAFEDAEFTVKDDQKGDYKLRFGSFMKEGPFNKDGDRLKKDWKSIAISLLTNHRQKSEDPSAGEFIDALNAIGEGCDFNDPAVLPLMKRVYVRNKDGYYVNHVNHELLPNTDAATHAFTDNRDVSAHNEKIKDLMLAKGDRQVRTYKAKVVPNGWKVAEILKHVEPIEREQTLYEGQKFMVRCNIPNSALKNGTTGTVVGLQKNKVILKLGSGETVPLENSSFPMPMTASGKEAGIFETVAMGHGANGSTIWKLQGITLKSAGGGMEDALVVNLKRRLYGKVHGLAYVFCSRVQEISQLYIKVDDLNLLNKYVHCDPRVLDFVKSSEENMKKLLAEQAELPVEKTKFIAVVKARRSEDKERVAVMVNIENTFYDVVYDSALLPTRFIQYLKPGSKDHVDVEPSDDLKLELIEATLQRAAEVD